MTDSEARERVLNVAEKLFMERGYAGVTLKDIADSLKMRQASLYYHVPGGKEALFVEVAERGLHRHRHGLEDTMQKAGPDIREKLRAAARWMLVEPMPDLGRMQHSDMLAIEPEHAEHLMHVAYQSLMLPIDAVLRRAHQEGQIITREPTMIAGAFLAIMNSVRSLPVEFLQQRSKDGMSDTLIDVLLNGLKPR